MICNTDGQNVLDINVMIITTSAFTLDSVKWLTPMIHKRLYLKLLHDTTMI